MEWMVVEDMEWIVVEDKDIEPPAPRCPNEGKHKFRLAIEEGQVTLIPTENCSGECWRPEHEELEMAMQPTKFKLEVRRTCFDENNRGCYGTCDCNIWYQMVPV